MLPTRGSAENINGNSLSSTTGWSIRLRLVAIQHRVKKSKKERNNLKCTNAEKARGSKLLVALDMPFLNSILCTCSSCFAPSSAPRNYFIFRLIISRDAPLWGNWLRTLPICYEVRKESKEEKKAHHPAWFEPTTSRVFCSQGVCSTTVLQALPNIRSYCCTFKVPLFQQGGGGCIAQR